MSECLLGRPASHACMHAGMCVCLLACKGRGFGSMQVRPGSPPPHRASDHFTGHLSHALSFPLTHTSSHPFIAFSEEYRAQLDAERASRLARGTNHAGEDKKDKKDKKRKSERALLPSPRFSWAGLGWASLAGLAVRSSAGFLFRVSLAGRGRHRSWGLHGALLASEP